MTPTDEMVRAAAEAIYNVWAKNREVEATWEECVRLKHSIAREAEEEGRAALSAALAAMWQPIENAKPNTSYILGWHDWRDGQWCMEIGPAITGERFPNGYSSVSHHGSATHFAPRLPAPSQLSKRDDAERDSPQEA